jgi:hypothetical protein
MCSFFRSVERSFLLYAVRIPPAIFLHGFLLVVGAVFFILHFYSWVLPNWNFNRNFEQTVCTVLDTKIAETKRNYILFYRPEIFIEYQFHEQNYRLWTYDESMLVADSELGYVDDLETIQKIVDSYKKQEQYPCWVKISDPKYAILFHPSPMWGWFFLMIPVSLAGSGFVGLWLTMCRHGFFRRRFTSKLFPVVPFLTGHKTQTQFPAVPAHVTLNDSPGTRLAFRLPTSQISMIRVFGAILLGFFWNVISWVILFCVFFTDEKGSVSIFSRLFAIFFCLVGVGLIAWGINLVLAALSVGATLLELSDHPIIPGRKFRLHLTQFGTFRIRQYTVAVVCEEVARFRQGTDTITNRKTVYSKEIFTKSDFETVGDTPLETEILFLLPYGVMHSLMTEHNEIRWKIAVSAEIAGLSDLYRECPIIVHPSAVASPSYFAEDDDDLLPR